MAVTANGPQISKAVCVKAVPSCPLLPPPAWRSPLPAGFYPIANRQPLVEKMVQQIIGNNSNKSLAITMTQHSVDVFGQQYALNVYQYAENLWIADGEFLGHQLRTIDRTALKAVRAWQKAAIEKRLFAEVGWHGWVKVAGAFWGLLRELRGACRQYNRFLSGIWNESVNRDDWLALNWPACALYHPHDPDQQDRADKPGNQVADPSP